MKITFNDASEMTIQSATIRTDGSLLIKTISVTEDELRNTFQDEFRTKKITVTERETTVAEYEDYTNLNALVKYTGGILGVVMYREKESPMDRIDALEEHVDNLTKDNKSREAENAELIVNGKRVENDLSFTATDTKMEVQIEFIFNASELGGKELVTFEELYDVTNPDNPIKVAEHKDIKDEGQTVTIKEKPESPTTPEEPSTPIKTSDSPKTGDNTPFVALFAMMGISAAGLIFAGYKRFRRVKKSD